MLRKDKILDSLKTLCQNISLKDIESGFNGFDATTIGKKVNISRSNTSTALNELMLEKKVVKTLGKPVFYIDKDFIESTLNISLSEDQFKLPNLSTLIKPNNKIVNKSIKASSNDIFDKIIGFDKSLKLAINQAKAAILYPPKGLHSLLVGPTGVGKSTFAEIMYEYALINNKISKDKEFVIFNCAEYADNPHLLLSQLFGYIKGAFTGADKNKDGLIDKANGGIILLDEIHRLPPEGQEMLFLVMDKGIYRRLGETDITRKANVLFICATTEDINSSLLKTFLRRVPMVIKLPSLAERTLTERFELVKQFFDEESKLVGVPIKIHKDVLKAFLLYSCSGNIGQLKADIQLTCARAFLDYKTYMKNQLEIDISSIPDYIYEGLLNAKDKRDELPTLFQVDYNKYYEFSGEGDSEFDLHQVQHHSKDLYNEISKQYNSYTQMGYEQNKINEILNNHIEGYLQNLLSKYNTKKKSIQKEELFKIVRPEIYYAVELGLNEAEKSLTRSFSQKVYIALSMHISALLENISDKKLNTRNLEINKIAATRPREFEAARIIHLILKEKLNVTIPEEEIGFIAMFLYTVDSNLTENNTKIPILVLCHGKSTATSIAEVANTLMDTTHCLAIDMPLDEKINNILEKATKVIKDVDEGKGVLILVDMGSLVAFSEIITKSTGIETRCVEMVSTPMVLEAVRKSILPNMDLDTLANDLQQLNPYMGRMVVNNLEKDLMEIDNSTIITTCLTGEGSAVKIADLLKRSLPILNELNISITPMNVDKVKSFNIKNNNKNILAVVGTFDLNIPDIPYISIDEIVIGNGLKRLEKLLVNDNVNIIDSNSNDEISLIINVLTEGLSFLNPMKAYKLLNISFEEIKSLIAPENYYKVKIGFILHCSYMIERCLKNDTLPYNNAVNLIKENSIIHKSLLNSLTPIEDAFSCKIPDEELSYLIDLILVNQ